MSLPNQNYFPSDFLASAVVGHREYPNQLQGFCARSAKKSFYINGAKSINKINRTDCEVQLDAFV